MGIVSLELGNGVVIDDPLAEALEFVTRDGTYQGYDDQPSDPDHLTPDDIHLANRIRLYRCFSGSLGSPTVRLARQARGGT